MSRLHRIVPWVRFHLLHALQVDFSCVNAFIQETSMGIHYNEGTDLLDYLQNPEVFKVNDGYVDTPSITRSGNSD